MSKSKNKFAPRAAVVAEIPPEDPADFVDPTEIEAEAEAGAPPQSIPAPPASVVEEEVLPDYYDENIVLIPTATVSAHGYKARRVEGNLPPAECIVWHEILRGLKLSGAELNATEHKPARKVKTLFHAVLWVAQNVIPK